MKSKLDILAIAVHPDDVELSCAATLIKHKNQGKKTGILDLTKGELGTRGSAHLRMDESKESARILQLDYRKNLGFKDGFVDYSEASISKIVREIRRTKPEIVLANAPFDRHPDHGNASKLIRDACFYSGLQKYKTNDADNVEQWRPKVLYYYIQDYNLEPDFLVDVSDHVDQKFESILAFKSQFFQEGMDGPTTPISGQDFLEYLKSRMRVWGRAIGAEYAEGFIVDRTIGINDLFDLI